MSGHYPILLIRSASVQIDPMGCVSAPSTELDFNIRENCYDTEDCRITALADISLYALLKCLCKEGISYFLALKNQYRPLKWSIGQGLVINHALTAP